MSRSILVTGASGFIGSHLLESLLADGHPVIAMDLRAPRLQHPRLRFVQGSFIDLPGLDELMSECGAVFHLASTTLPKSSNDDPRFDVSSNLVGTLRLLELARTTGVGRFIFASSGGTIYGPPEVLPVSEEQGTHPICSYGIVKLAIEKYLLMYHHLYGLDTCSLRMSNPYGEYQRPDTGQGAVTVFCHKVVNNEPIEIWGDGSVVRDFIHIDDVVRAMRCTLSADCGGKVINIGYGAGSSLNDILREIEHASGQRPRCTFKPARGFDVPAIYLDIRRAGEVLGWSPQVSLSEGIRRMIQALRAAAGQA